MLSTALIPRGYVLTPPRAVASAVENPTGPPPSPSGGPHPPFLEQIPGLPAVVDNGEELVVNVSACTGGDGVYGRPAFGVEESIILDVSKKLQAMHLARKVEVEAAARAAPSGRRPVAIMSDNAAAVGARSVSVLSRLCDGVMADAAFQRVRITRLRGGTPTSGVARTTSRASPATDRVTLGDGLGTAALPCAPSSSSPTADPTSSTALAGPPSQVAVFPVVLHPPKALSPAPQLVSSTRTVSHAAVILPVVPPSDAHRALPPSSQKPLSSTDGMMEADRPTWSHAEMPLIKSCRELDALWHNGQVDGAGVIVVHPLSVLCDPVQRKNLYPGRLLRAFSTKATRYKRVAAEIAAVGGIDKFVEKWGDCIVGRVYASLTRGASKGRKRLTG